MNTRITVEVERKKLTGTAAPGKILSWTDDGSYLILRDATVQEALEEIRHRELMNVLTNILSEVMKLPTGDF